MQAKTRHILYPLAIVAALAAGVAMMHARPGLPAWALAVLTAGCAVCALKWG